MRRLGTTLAVALALALSATACSTTKTTGGATSSRTLVIAGSGTSFARNFNPFPLTGNGPWGPGISMIYEPLVAVDHATPTKFAPWLATSWAFSKGGKDLTFTVRKGVTWSDGKPLTAADVKYSLDAYRKAGWSTWTDVTTSGDTVTVHYPVPTYTAMASYMQYVIVPKHIWAGHNAMTWTDPDPVGTGPVVLDKFSPQAMFLHMRDGYWGGKSKGVSKLEILAVAQQDALVSDLNSDKIDWAGTVLPSNGKQFTSTDPTHHQYTYYSSGASEGVTFNAARAPFNDLNVRKAFVAAANVPQMAKADNSGLPVPSVTGLDPAVWGSSIPAAYDKPQAQDLSTAKQDLAAGGWTVQGGKLVKGGKSYSVSYTVPNSNPNAVTEAQLLAQQWQDALGVNVAVNQVGDNANSQIESTGNFDMAFTACAYNGWTLASAYGQFKATNNVPLGKAASANIGRWVDPKFQALLLKYGATDPSDTSTISQLSSQMVGIIGDQAPFLPTHTQGTPAELDTLHWTNWPAASGSDHVIANSTNPADVIGTLMNLEPTGK
ncbi:MAG: ABC transporter substrate-binding protein [Nocardioidaceae bacterium]|nr:ABC transporter substrate-binding protein [Nocardioidaceae bacterium]MCL2613603.1 ABC transporter substrate-binding protein [Nocardioidaceae bacterium]